jgi:hypothetical protein
MLRLNSQELDMHRQLHQNMGLATSINRRWDANPDALNQSQTTSQLGIMMP